MDGPWFADATAIPRSGRTPRDLGAGLRLRRSDRYACAAQGPERRRVCGDPLPEQGRRGRPVANRDPRPLLGLLQRDFAVLFVEAARCLGFGARLVSGYHFNPDQMLQGSTGAGSTHAWGEVFVSAAGWISFDPTNRSVGGANLIPVAVARDIRQAAPVSGAYAESSDALESMSVEVLVTSCATPSWRQASGQSSCIGAAPGRADCLSA